MESMFYEVIPAKAMGGVLTYQFNGVDDGASGETDGGASVGANRTAGGVRGGDRGSDGRVGRVSGKHQACSLAAGTVVEVPLGRTRVAGIVVRKVSRPPFATKPITRVIYPQPLPRHLLLAIKFIAEYYAAPIGSAAAMVLPTGILTRAKAKTKAKIGAKTVKTTKTGKNGVFDKRLTGVELAQKMAIPLNSAQQNALQALQQASGATKLLFGDTGSGKTNVYLSEAARALSRGKSVIVLVPEIALTSQLVAVFREKFGDLVTLLHSQQKTTERRQIFEETLACGSPRVVIGPRSALFAPVADLGLIVVDEEHEETYYQENAPRYSAVRVASFLASALSIPCILGSATPNVVDFYIAKQRGTVVRLQGKAKELATESHADTSESVHETASGTVPKSTKTVAAASGITTETTSGAASGAASGATFEPMIRLVDFKNRAEFAKNRYFSNALLQALKNNLAAGRQTLIFHNRRGSAPLTICDVCGEEIVCPTCFLPLTLHADSYELVCHTCGFRRPVPATCPKCGAPGLVHKGFGTKLLETELRSLFPKARIRRFDADNKKGESLAAAYDAVRDGEVDILVGTQTLAKGLDLPRLATVGVVQADAGLSLPCFSAEERTFQLLTQVIGRVGRGHLDTAEVIIQTFRPEHPMLTFAIRGDYEGFYEYLMRQRRAGGWPPFRFVAQVSITLKTERLVVAKVRRLAAKLAALHDFAVSPPMPAFHERTSRGYTWQVVVRSRSRAKLVKALTGLDKSFKVVFDPPTLL